VKYTVDLAGRSVVVDVEGDTVTVAGRRVQAMLDGPRMAVRRLVIDGRAMQVVVAAGEHPGSWLVSAEGRRFEARVLDERALAIRSVARGGVAHRSDALRAPMPGLIVRVLVSAGESVAAGRGVVVMEAMKMENELKAAADGVVGKVLVAAGDKVEKGAVLVEFA